MTVWKFTLNPEGLVEMPKGAEILCVQMQREQPCVWARVDETAPKVTRKLYVIGTGHPAPIGAGRYVGSVQMHGGFLVLHVFDSREEYPPAMRDA